MTEKPNILEYGAPIPLFDELDLPPHEAIVVVSDKKAQRLGDLALHRDDLAFAMECLEALQPMATSADSVPARALWMSAVVTFMKCFGDSDARFALNEKKVFKGEERGAGLEAFQFFKELRHRHVVHDANSYMRVHTGAVINLATESTNVHSIVSLTIRAHVIDQASYGNLHRLVSRSLGWVKEEFESLAATLQSELERESREALLSRQSIHHAAVPPPDLAASRPRV